MPEIPIRIRPAQPRDCAGLARLQVESYQKAYAGLFPQAYLDHFSFEEQEQDWRDWLPSHPEEIILVAEAENGEIAGYGRGLRLPAEDEVDGELAALHVRQDAQGQGHGRRLTAAVARELHQRGCHSLLLWVLAGNPARGFYERLGGQLMGEKCWFINEINFEVVEVAYGWKDITRLFN